MADTRAARVYKRTRSVKEYSLTDRSVSEYSFTDGATYAIRAVRSWTVHKRMNLLPVCKRTNFLFFC